MTKIKPYLIQRCQFKNVKPGEIKGFDSVASCDYMGSSEFEFGALPASLRVITASLDEYGIHESGLRNKDGEWLFLLCKSSDVNEIRRILNILKDSRQRIYRLKERMGLEDSLIKNRVEIGYRYMDLFWDIENHWMCGFKKDNMHLLVKGLERLRDRWITEGKISPKD